jgi:asparagine synthase (glutamine-hydrolysing)
MCGIAGIIDLSGALEPDRSSVQRMTEALRHRGPDEDGYLFAPGLGLGQRRLSIVGLLDGRQPIFNEDRALAVVFNGELFDYPERKRALETKGHVFRTHTDTETIVHLYEEHGEDVFEQLNGQFAFVLVDFTKRSVFLARDRVGICPLHWSKQGNQVYFGSEISALLASGGVPAACDPRGLDHIFTFFAMGARRTMFAGVQSLLPGHYLKIEFRRDGAPADVIERRYWDLDFPDQGDEEDSEDPNKLIDELDATFRRAVEVRLRADVPVVGYLSGGVDSATVLAVASTVRGAAVPSFTIGMANADLDETSEAIVAARHIGSRQTIITSDAALISETYPKLVTAANSPVTDTSCAALWRLAREVHQQGYKVVLTGEGADEAFAGYSWFKMQALLQRFDIARLRPSVAASRLIRKILPPHSSISEQIRIDRMIGGPHAQSELYSSTSMGRQRFYSPALKEQLGNFVAYEDYAFDIERIRRWHPLNRSLYLGYKIQLAGLLLNHKGDRVAMANSVETRYPFLDDAVIKFAARLHPRWKLRGFTQDKFLLRQVSARYLPTEVALRPKSMFRAPFAASFFNNPPSYVDQLMSAEALRKTGYFDAAQVRRDYIAYRAGRLPNLRIFLQMGLVNVLATQLWHHLHLGGDLCELPRPEPE